MIAPLPKIPCSKLLKEGTGVSMQHPTIVINGRTGNLNKIKKMQRKYSIPAPASINSSKMNNRMTEFNDGSQPGT
jgi:hypothetical protein